MAATYQAQIRKQWDWRELVESTRWDAKQHDDLDACEANDFGCDSNGHVGYAYLGMVTSLTPSGKYYTFWAQGNVSEAEVDADSRWFDALERVARENDGSIEHGDDPVDVYFLRYWYTEDLA